MKRLGYLGHIFIAALLLTSCQSAADRESENEMFVINTLFLLRIEGMALCEIASDANPSPEVLLECDRLKAYYTTTQKEFTELCDGRSIAVQSEDFDAIWTRVQSHLLKDSAQREIAFIDLSTDNILRSIALHELILQQRDWEDITYYAFKSLPELYKQQGSLSQLKESYYVEKSPKKPEITTALTGL